jgi:hypothetical protein
MKTKIIQRFFFLNDKLVKMYKRFANFYNYKSLEQKGGFSIEYHNEKIKFDKVVDDNLTTLFLSTIDGNSNCILILIYKDDNNAILQGISNDECFTTPLFNNVKHLMTIAIKFLKKYKNKFNIKYVELTDNSYISCDKKTRISLADLSLLQFLLL